VFAARRPALTRIPIDPRERHPKRIAVMFAGFKSVTATQAGSSAPPGVLYSLATNPLVIATHGDRKGVGSH